MSQRAREFVAEELWLLIAVVTLPLAGLGGLVAEPVGGAIAMIGWFLLTPVLLFWGKDIAALLYADDNSEAGADDDIDAVETLKRRYAEGELSDEEFERRLDRLVALDEADEELFLSADTESGTGQGDTTRRTKERELE